MKQNMVVMVNLFNRSHAVGTAVCFLHLPGCGRITRTTSKARLDAHGNAIIGVECETKPVPLWRVVRVENPDQLSLPRALRQSGGEDVDAGAYEEGVV